MTTHTGRGTYVDVHSQETEHPTGIDAGYVGGRNLILEKWDQTFDLISGLKDQVLEALETLDDLTVLELPEGWEDILHNVVIDDLSPIVDEEGRPTPPTLELPDDWPSAEDIPILGTLKEVPNVDLSFTEPTVPDAPDPTVNYLYTPFVSDIYSSVFDKIYDVLTNGTSGLDEDAEQAIYDRAIARQRTAHAREYKTAIDASGSDGFNLAGGAQAAVLLTVSSNLTQEETNLNNDIIVKQAELAFQAMQFFTEKGLALDEMMRKFHIDKERLSLEAQLEIARFVLQKYSEEIRVYIAQWEGIKIELEAKAQLIDVVLKQNQLTLEVFKGEMTAYTAEIDLIARKIDAIVAGNKAEVDLFAAITAERAAWWRALTEEQRNLIEQNRLEMELAIAEVKALLDGTVSLNTLKEKITESTANITAQVLASALAAVQTSLTHGTSKSEQISENWGHGDQLTETHSFTDV